jgi:hypothetical protein
MKGNAMRSLLVRLREERGISAIVVAVSLIAIMGAAVLSVDAGSAWKTKRNLVTITDAAALAAARMFANNLADPCTSAGQAAAEAAAVQVMQANSTAATHDTTNTPNGFQVTTSGTCPAPAGQITPGHVRFDARLLSTSGFSGIFGAGRTNVIASSTAQFGYAVGNPGGLRPWAVCDQHNSTFPNPLVNPPSSPYPHYELFRRLRAWIQAGRPATPGSGQVTQAQYDAYFGVGATGNANSDEYPTVSFQGGSFLSPANGGGVVHRINSEDNCGGGASWRGWIDLDGGNNATQQDIANWILNGYNGYVALTPHNCSSGGQANGDCYGVPGNHNGTIAALDSIRCAPSVQSKNCFKFPIIVDQGVSGNGNNLDVNQRSFVFVILRGYNNGCVGNGGCVFQLEFVDEQTTGSAGQNSGGSATPVITSICGIDHDTQSDRCSV